MTRINKLYAQIINNPKNVKYENLDKILRQHGFQCRQPGKGSSHYTYFHDDLPEIITIPYTRPIKAIYVKIAIEAIKKLEGRELE